MSMNYDAVPEPMSEGDWKKQQEKRQKMYDEKMSALQKAAPKNDVVSNMSKEAKEDKNEQNDEKNTQWRVIREAFNSAEELYMEEDLTFEEACTQLCDAIEAACGENEDGGETDKQVAKKMGYTK